MITWSENYLMGVEELDNEHRHLFRIAEQILDKIRTRGDEEAIRMFVLREGLNYLNGYFSHHAMREEAYMRKIGYDGYALHKMQHDDFQNVQLAKYRKILETGSCSKEDIWDFIGSGVGWLLEHITTADMAIVGKGVLSKPAQTDINMDTLEREINSLFTATLNIEAHAKIVSAAYGGEPFGKVVCHRIVWEKDGEEITLIAGLERSFMLGVAKMLYGDSVMDEMDLVFSTVETFGAQFWLTLYRQLTGDSRRIDIKQNGFLARGVLLEEIQKIKPTSSILFTSDKGKFFITTNSQQFLPSISRTA